VVYAIMHCNQMYAAEKFHVSGSNTVKTGLRHSSPQPGRHLPNSPWPGIIYPVPVPGRFGFKKCRNLVKKNYSELSFYL